MSYVNANNANFDGNDFATVVPGLNVLALDAYRTPVRKLSINQLSRENKRKVSGAFWVEKDITIRVGIVRPTRDSAEQAIDLLVGYLQGQEKPLLVPQSSTTRRYTATLSAVSPVRAGTAYWEADLVFSLSDSYGYDTALTNIVNAIGWAGITRYDQYNFDGSADFQAPIFTLSYTTSNDTTARTIQVGSAVSGQGIIINTVVRSGDVIVVDSMNENVYQNNVVIDFTGTWPRFPKGLSNLLYTDNMTNRVMNYRADYYRRFS